MAFDFTPDRKKMVRQLLKRYPERQAALIPTLQLAQDQWGYLSDDAIKYVSELLDLPPSRVYSVSSFYTRFYKEEVGKYVLQVCRTLSCALSGAEQITSYLKKKLNIELGETTPDRKFTLLAVECIASCGSGPVMVVNDTYYENLTTEKIDEILNSLE